MFEERLKSGLYDELVNNLDAMGKAALGNVDCPADFARYQPAYSTNIEYRTKEGYEFRTVIVGEIAGPMHGTVMRAIGNYYAGDNNVSNTHVLILVLSSHLLMQTRSFNLSTTLRKVSRIFWPLQCRRTPVIG